jgi:hypothetical protein
MSFLWIAYRMIFRLDIGFRHADGNDSVGTPRVFY